MTNRLRELRKARGLTQVELATALKVNEITVVRWERGYTRISPDMLMDLARFFGVAPCVLLPDLGKVPPQEMTHV